MANSENIGKFYAVRRAKRQVGPNPLNEYDVTIIDNEGHKRTAVVEHYHADGAWSLVAKALLEFETAPASSA